MLKVNLLVDKSAPKQAKKVSSSATSGSNSTNFKDIFGEGLEVKNETDVQGQVLKFILIVGFAGGLFAYEKIQLNKNTKAIAAKNAELNEIKTLLDEKTQSVAGLEELKSQQKEQNEYISQVKSKMIERMHVLKGLDFIQSAVVKDLWLKSVEYDDGAFTLAGLFLQKSSLDKFYDNLNKVPIFKKSLIIKDSESSSGVKGAFEFSIMTNLKLKLDEKEEGEFGV